MRAIGVIFCALLFFSCTLDYDQTSGAKDTVPELVFQDAVFQSYEEGKIKSQLSGSVLEQYKSTGAFYGKNVEFSTWNSSTGEKEAQGSCGLLQADSKTNDYAMFDGIQVKDYKRGIEINAQKIKWNGKTEQLTSGRNDFVTLKRDDIEVKGMGFSASGISRQFSFEEQVSGKIITQDTQDTQDTSTDTNANTDTNTDAIKSDAQNTQINTTIKENDKKDNIADGTTGGKSEN